MDQMFCCVWSDLKLLVRRSRTPSSKTDDGFENGRWHRWRGPIERMVLDGQDGILKLRNAIDLD